MMQSCVTNNLDDCPDSVRYAIAFEYTLHTETSNRMTKGLYDRFYDDVDKMYIYVFDAATGICVLADTALLAPFKNDFTYPLPLSTGRYDIITWGWGRNPGDHSLRMSTAVVPTVVPGTTSINDARLQLEAATISGKLERIFYSERRDLEITAFMSRIDTLPLMNISNMIRVVIPDARTAKMQDEISISITGDDGAYRFNSTSAAKAGSYDGVGYFRSGFNSPDIDAVRGNVVYLPFRTYRTDSILLADPIYRGAPYQGTGRDSMLIVEMSSLRLVQDNPNMVLVVNWDGDLFKFSLIDLLRTATSSSVQYDLDRYHRWEISYEVSSTYATASVSVIDWHRKLTSSDIGGLLQ